MSVRVSTAVVAMGKTVVSNRSCFMDSVLLMRAASSLWNFGLCEPKRFLLAGIAGKHCRRANMYRTSAVGTEEREKANTNSLRGGWNEKYY